MALDPNGFIPLPPVTEFQAEFLPVIAAVTESLVSCLGERLHSLYLYGSVALGRAQASVSDLDVCILLEHTVSESERHQLAQIARDISSRYPVVSKIDFDIGEVSEALAAENLYRWGYWLKHHCRCIYGKDLTQRFQPFKPSQAIAVAVNGDFSAVLGKYIEQLTLLKEAAEQKSIQRAAARKLIRSTQILRTNTDSDWPETLGESATQLVARYPQQAAQIHYFLHESMNPTDNAASFIRHLTTFMSWLEITFQLKANE